LTSHAFAAWSLTNPSPPPQCRARIFQETPVYAVIDENGRQFKVTEGDRIRIDRAIDEGTKTITFDRVLLVGGGDGDAKIGGPLLSGATVTADVLGEVSGPKVVTQKYVRRKGYHKKIGHRQHYTEVKITGISA
jgi:large subunit ribosomal protein L21